MVASPLALQADLRESGTCRGDVPHGVEKLHHPAGRLSRVAGMDALDGLVGAGHWPRLGPTDFSLATTCGDAVADPSRARVVNL